MTEAIKWNDQVRLIISDVDETIADLYIDATTQMIKELNRLLQQGIKLFLISGQSVSSIHRRIGAFIDPLLRKNIIIGHCSGAEVYRYSDDGVLDDKPLYSLYESRLDAQQKFKFREVISALINEFHLNVYPAMPIKVFKLQANDDPLAIMFEDRIAQITFEVVNGYSLTIQQVTRLGLIFPQEREPYDLRDLIMQRAQYVLGEAGVPIEARLGGVFAIDFVIAGASKTKAIQFVAGDEKLLVSLELPPHILKAPELIEVWGDKFGRGGSDSQMSLALPPAVRSISFRKEDISEFPFGYNIIVWDGSKRLHEGLEEYLQAR
jgi:hydroxymethylpyrimidine pyrophosphatase-like HAD family hydrolase